MALSVIQACRSLALSTWLLSFCFVHLLCLDFTVAEKEEWYTAFVNITYVDPVTAEVRTEKTECGRYGEHSLKREARGVLAMPAAPQDRHACDPNSRFTPRGYGAWIALISRGNCTYRDKIRNAVGKNASAVVIFNVGSSNPNETITMSDPGDALDQCIITFIRPYEIFPNSLIFFLIMVTLNHNQKESQKHNFKTCEILFFLTNSRRLGDAAKKAISQLQVRTIRKGDQETESDFDNCAVCIEGYKANDVVRILPCRHLFHKGCVDPWLVDHRTCPMCKMNILKALGLTVGVFSLSLVAVQRSGSCDDKDISPHHSYNDKEKRYPAFFQLMNDKKLTANQNPSCYNELENLK
uniref:RING finger protein 150-like n=1 Tax=Sinocyclocheilus rhinocerous TaxID=307959 RepID=A0A673KQC3_9TELE